MPAESKKKTCLHFLCNGRVLTNVLIMWECAWCSFPLGCISHSVCTSSQGRNALLWKQDVIINSRYCCQMGYIPQESDSDLCVLTKRWILCVLWKKNAHTIPADMSDGGRSAFWFVDPFLLKWWLSFLVPLPPLFFFSNVLLQGKMSIVRVSLLSLAMQVTELFSIPCVGEIMSWCQKVECLPRISASLSNSVFIWEAIWLQKWHEFRMQGKLSCADTVQKCLPLILCKLFWRSLSANWSLYFHHWLTLHHMDITYG